MAYDAKRAGRHDPAVSGQDAETASHSDPRGLRKNHSGKFERHGKRAESAPVERTHGRIRHGNNSIAPVANSALVSIATLFGGTRTSENITITNAPAADIALARSPSN
jgi:hypothetical protein